MGKQNDDVIHFFLTVTYMYTIMAQRCPFVCLSTNLPSYRSSALVRIGAETAMDTCFVAV